jgi:hypothetical protein
MKRMIALTLVFLLLIAVSPAQDSGGPALSPRSIGESGLIIPVKVWGEVVRPGIYDVPIEYDLLAVLSVAGGPENTAKLTNVKVLRGQRIYKDEPIVVYVDLQQYIDTGNEDLIPEIRRGDTIMVPPKFGKNFVRNLAAILAIAQSIVIMAYYIDRVTE